MTKAMRISLGLLLLLLGVSGVLDLKSRWDWSQTAGRWWPSAVILFGFLGMIFERRFRLDLSIIILVGLALLAREQPLSWLDDRLVWFLLLLAIGLLIFLEALFRPWTANRQDSSDERPEIT
jgi:hypothetical protein